MKKLLSLLFVLGLTLSACGPSQTQSVPPAQTSTPTLTPTATQTPIPPTATVTPLPTIPTFTPTFDVSTIITVTPAEKVECAPAQTTKDASEIDFSYSQRIIQSIIVNLNEGVSIEVIERDLNTHYQVIKGSVLHYSKADVTNDEAQELILRFSPDVSFIYVIGCQNDKYTIRYSYTPALERSTYKIINDANKNGLPELLIGADSCSSTGCFGEFSVIEWAHNKFQKLLDEPYFDTWLDSIGEKDIDNDGVMEFYWAGGVPVFPSWDYFLYGPLRLETHIYKWNGNVFAVMPIIYAPPQYRFQAIQDADQHVIIGRCSDAFQLYQEVIANKNLDWWSHERYDQQHDIALTLGTSLATPTLTASDLTEYPRLAAYAYYRIMLIHLVQGQEAEATSTYQTLQETFGTNPYAAPYVEMASAFWESYQSTSKMYDGCAAAIQYTVEHPEILIPLGSDYHGWQSHIYEPADVCPFR